MYAIVDFKGYQYKVEKDQILKVPYLHDAAVGSEITIDKVLLLHDDKNTIVGQPTVAKATVSAEVVAHKKDKKIIIFKKKRRKGYQKKQGHRQDYTEIRIKNILN
ncbi:MAG: 50S ribosomal protein L21 [Candidatus Cloacimonetes bacterium]|nr:50S ribosomal protein L21 [Candidatus Cloacimonadota bacterium]